MLAEIAYVISNPTNINANSSRATHPAVVRDIAYYDESYLIWDGVKSHTPQLSMEKGQYEIAPQSNTFTRKIEQPSTETLKTTAAVNPRDMVEKIRAALGLNNVQIADILGISRPSLYNHLSEKESPKSLEGYQRLYNIALYADGQKSNIKLGLKSILIDGNTLLGHLKTSLDDHEKIIRVCAQVAEKLSGATAKPRISTDEQRRLSRDITRFS